MKNFFMHLLSDSNKYSMKRFIGLLSLIMFMAFGISALFKPFNLNFWMFYISLCIVTIWIAFKFMSAEKLLKYDILGKLTKFGSLKDVTEELTTKEKEVDASTEPVSENKSE